MIPKELEGYDWEQAFLFVSGNSPNVSPVIGSSAPATSFSRDDVVRVVAAEDGENDDANWICIVELKDGRFAFLSAGCDYTGWDCQSGGHAMVDTDLNRLIRLGTDESARDRLKLLIAE
jgi:hypothetical protein